MGVGTVGEVTAQGTNGGPLSPAAGTTSALAPYDSYDVVILDDHVSYGQAIVLALRAARPTARAVCTTTPAQLLEIVDRTALVLLDWQLGDADGLDTARAVSARPNAPHIVMLSGHCSPALRRLAADAGVCAVLSKQDSFDAIMQSIDRCRTGCTRQAGGPVAIDDAPLLSRRQVEVLWLLSTGCDPTEAAKRLYLSVATVRTYIRDACRRLGAHSQLEAVAKARRAGLIPIEVGPPTARS